MGIKQYPAITSRKCLLHRIAPTGKDAAIDSLEKNL